MPETGLTLTYADLQSQVGFFLFGQDDVTMIAPFDLRTLARVITNGLRRFYYPMQIMDGTIHDWSFLRTKLTLKLASGTSDYEMPFDFGGAEGDLYHDPSDNIKFPVRKVTPDKVLERRMYATTLTAWPQIYAERAVHKGGRQSTRWEIMVWPDPAASYTLLGTYRVLPLAPGTAQNYLYGGPEHSQTIVEACLAAAELQMGDPGVHAQEFASCLKTSIALDQSMHQPEYLGYNGGGGGNSSLMRGDGYFENFDAVTSNGRVSAR